MITESVPVEYNFGNSLRLRFFTKLEAYNTAHITFCAFKSPVFFLHTRYRHDGFAVIVINQLRVNLRQTAVHTKSRFFFISVNLFPAPVLDFLPA
jgi:hypothetical protein